MATSTNGAVELRVLTANVQSFPTHAITLDEAREDLIRNAAAADIVLLQEIADRYQRLVEEAFPASDWEVFYGRRDNTEPIAYRRGLFQRLEGRVTQLHPPRPGLHGRRFTTYTRLGIDSHGGEVHVTNLHLVARAFSNPPSADRALRVREWHEAISKHLTFVDSLVESGHPVLGGGDYNRQLKRHPSLGTEVAGRKVRYAVDPTSIDLLWFIDGGRSRWTIESRELFGGRDSKSPRRHSDHGARLAVVRLQPNGSPAATPGPVVTTTHQPQGQGGGSTTKTQKMKKNKKKPPRPDRPDPTPHTQRRWPPPFEKTKYGVDGAKTVDWKTRAALEAAERILGYRLTIVQGSYNTTVGASAGTHDQGGVVDLRAFDHERKLRALRRVGFAAWRRLSSEGPWSEHIHAVLVDHGKLAPVAASQVADYRAHKNGLKSHLPDRTWRPDPIPVFEYPPKDQRPETPPEPEAPVAARQAEDRDRHQDTDQEPALDGPAYPPRRTLDGVDTSHYQSGKIDLRLAQHAGLRWWYCKTTEGESMVDQTYRKRVREARRAGVPVGAYHFARPDGGDAVTEAKHFLKHADIRVGDMVPMLDLESSEVLSREKLTEWVGMWVTTVRQRLEERGLRGSPIIYTHFDLDKAFGCLLWVARYSDDLRPPRIPSPWKRAAVWQHSNGKVGPITKVPGFGPVDVNAMHPDLPLSSLRVHRPRKATDVDLIRRDLTVAMARLDDALRRLPER